MSMSSSRKKRKKRSHQCANHPDVVAKGRCIECGKWICFECTVLYKRDFHCLYCISEKVVDSPVKKVDEDVAEKVDEDVAEKVDEDVAEKVDENVGEKVDEDVAEKVGEDVGEKVGEDVGKKTAEFVVPKILLSQKPSLHPQSETESIYQRIFPIVGWSAITLLFFAILFVAWSVREIQILQGQNTILHKHHQKLSSTIEENNWQINLLQKRINHLVRTTSLESKEQSGKESDKIKKVVRRPPKITTPPPQPSKRINGVPITFDNGSISKKQVAFTFDAGSYANAADDILDTLRSRNVKTILFVTGEFIRRYPHVIRRFLAEGHEVGNHTLSHPHLTMWEKNRTHRTLPNISKAFIERQLNETASLFREKFGHELAPLWRAPFGEYNPTICKWAQMSGYMHVGWRRGKSWWENLDSNDWIPHDTVPGFKTPQEFVDKVMNLAKHSPHGINGGIILMHVGTAREKKEDQVHLIIGVLIDKLREIGYEVVSVSQLARTSGVVLGNLPSHTSVSAAAE